MGTVRYEDIVQVSADRKTVWVYGPDGSTVGRFSKTFGMDVHTTITEQPAGEGQCLHCTHTPPTKADWEKFCDLIQTHFGIEVSRLEVRFDGESAASRRVDFTRAVARAADQT